MSTRGPASAPSAPQLREAALRHLSRYAATRAQLTRVLDRRIERWRRAAEAAAPDDNADALATAARAAHAAARAVVAALAASNIVDDAAYAQSRAGALLRAGKSRQRTMLHLAQRGVPPDAIAAAVPAGTEAELGAAVLLVRRRRLGAFRPILPDRAAEAAAKLRERAVLARAGFSQATAREALRTEPDEAETLIAAWRASS